MINIDNYVNENETEHNKNWPYVPDHSYKILIIGGSGSGKTNALINLINDKKPEDAGIKHLNNPNAFIKCSNTMDDVYENVNDFNPIRKRKILIVFDEMIADIMGNKKFQAIIKELFSRCRKLNISLVFITQSYFSVPKDIRSNTTHYFIMKINNKRELKNIAINHSADIGYQDF